MEMQADAQKIRQWREDRCWSQEHLADAAGVSLRTVQRLEKGDSVSRDTIRALAAAFDVDAASLALNAGDEARKTIRKNNRKRRREAMLAFWIHLATYVGVIGLLFWINLASDREDLWVTWPAIGWGVGVFAHGAAVLISNHASAVEEDV